MEPFLTLSSLVVPLDRIDVDTDAILPKQYMAMIGREGFGDYLFDNWRYLDEGRPGDDCRRRPRVEHFVLNERRYEGAQIMLCRANFGCGSSREHAVWALAQWGIRALIAPSFADIFRSNCLKNGLLPITLESEPINLLFAHVQSQPGYALQIDLQAQVVRRMDGTAHRFPIDDTHKRQLLSGLDEIGQTLAIHRDSIRAFEAQRFQNEPWLMRAPL